MLVKIAEHIVSLEVPDEDVCETLKRFEAPDGARPEKLFSIPDEELRRTEADFIGVDRAHQAFILLADHFYQWLLLKGALCLHASAIVYNGKAYLFSAASGTGKSTHAGLWRKAFGPEVRVINDDAPILAKKDGAWRAYGAPWCGKDNLTSNISAPIAGIYALVRDENNAVRRLDALDAFTRIFSQTPRRYETGDMDRLMGVIEEMIAQVPVFELRCNQTIDAAFAARGAMEIE